MSFVVTSTSLLRWLTTHEGGGIFCRLCFNAGLLQEAKIAEPVDKSILPGSKRDSVAVGEAPGHFGAVGKRISWMAAVAVDVHFDVWHSKVEHGSEIFHGPDGVDAVAGAAADNEGRRHVSRYWRCGSAFSERGGARIDDADEIGSGVGFGVQDGCGGG